MMQISGYFGNLLVVDEFTASNVKETCKESL
jgi:hypothetical protein